MRTLFFLCTVMTFLTGCLASGISPVNYTVSYPDTTSVTTTSARVIPTGSSSFTINITFGESVTGFESSDISITGGSISSFTGNSEGTFYTIDVDVDMSEQPSVISFDVIGSIDVAFGKTWSPNISGSFAYDGTFPTTTVSYPDTTYDSPTDIEVITNGTSSFSINVVFSESVSDFEAGDISITGGSISSITSNSEGTVYTVNIDVDMSLQPSNIVVELVGAISDSIGREWTPDISGTFAYDGTFPTTTVSYPDTTYDSPTDIEVITNGTSSFSINVVFSESVSDFEAGDISITGGSISSITSNSEGTVYTVNIDVDMSLQPSNIVVELVGAISDSIGREWTPDISGTFAYDDVYPATTLSYPDTEDDGSGERIITAGSTSFQVVVEFSESVSEFEASDVTVTGGTVSSVTSNTDGTLWTISVDVDLTDQPSNIVLEITGDLETALGLVWLPDVEVTLAYPATDYTVAERQNEGGGDWGVSRATSATHSAVVYSSDYATTLANGVMPAAIDMASSTMELVEPDMAGGVSSYRGVVQIGDEVYSAEMHQTASGTIALRIFDPTDIVLTKGTNYTGSLAGSFDYTGVLSATKYEDSVNTYIQDDFTLTADFALDTFTIVDGPTAGGSFALIGDGYLDSTTGLIASDTLSLTHTDVSATYTNPNSVILFGNIHGDGTDVSGVFYNNGYAVEDGTDVVAAQYVGTIVGSQ